MTASSLRPRQRTGRRKRPRRRGSRPRRRVSDGGGPSGSGRNGASRTRRPAGRRSRSRSRSGAANPQSNCARRPPGNRSWPTKVRSTPRSSKRANAATSHRLIAGDPARETHRVAAHVPERAAAHVRDRSVGRWGSVRKNEKEPVTSSSGPERAALCQLDGVAAICGWWRYMKASTATRPDRRAASAIASASATDSASGFSHRTCLPASSARTVHAAWR